MTDHPCSLSLFGNALNWPPQSGVHGLRLDAAMSKLLPRFDFVPLLHQNTPVRSMIAGGTVAALLIVTLYAPLFHVHIHQGEAPLIHAHLPEVVPLEDESVVHMEAFHSHADARSIDLLTTTVVQSVHLDADLVTSVAFLDTTFISRGYVTAAAPVAHGPPDSALQIPRAPPA